MNNNSARENNHVPVISTIPEKCRRCYTCVRECPAKAIKVEEGQAVVIEERCIACGNCVKVCAQQAKRIQDSIDPVVRLLAQQEAVKFREALRVMGRRLLAQHDAVFACLAPSFPAAFEGARPGQVVAGLRELGFSEVWEVAFGAELISHEYRKLFDEARRTGVDVIATACPAIVTYVEKYMPSLQKALAPIVSPMIAAARAIRHLHPDARVVFIGPCIAKKNEIREPSISHCVDAVLSFRELHSMFEAQGIDPTKLNDSSFDSPWCHFGRALPISGGLFKAAGLGTDILESEIIVTEGKDRALDALKELAAGKSRSHFFDILFCEGCLNGPKMTSDRGMFARKDMIVDYVMAQSKCVTQRYRVEDVDAFKDVDLRRTFTSQNVELPQPTEEEIAATLASMKKSAPEDELNCGACGYPTCREKAIAVYQGLAEAEMCLPFLIDELEETCKKLKQSHEDLEFAHQRLVQTERLATMGQLSAGVAHELNNPLGTVLLYSHMLLRQVKAESPSRADIEMIVNEANRCKTIVRGLLDFARESRLSKSPTDIARIVTESVSVMLARAEQDNIRLTVEIEDGLPTMNIDGDQIKQVLINLVNNAIDAIDKENGWVVVCTWRRKEDDHVMLEVSDNGVGIASEHVDRLFTPFFTTKELGRGTGLGLAIAYGIVKMHSGDIYVQSKLGTGTTFTISLPVGREAATPAA